MAQAKITNKTLCECQVLFTSDELYRPVVSAIVKATFDILPNGNLKFASTQIPVNLEGEFYGDPESSSYRIEPEVAFFKPATDVVVLGDAVSPRGPIKHLMVEITVGDLYKKIGVIGNRRWLKQAVGYVMSEPEPFESIPLIYENAFGGWDRRHPDELKHTFEPRNTVGKGLYGDELDVAGVPMPLPNLEDPDNLIRTIKDRPAPVGCGFILPQWQPRSGFAGTYDQTWQENRSPMLPDDFDKRFFNGASPGLIANGYLAGNEPVIIKGMTEVGSLQFRLPGVRPPICEVIFSNTYETLTTVLDTVIIDVPGNQLQLIWRNFLLHARGPHDVEAVEVQYG